MARLLEVRNLTTQFTVDEGTFSAIENAIQNSRRYYNAVVRDLNTACDTVPSNFVASWFGIAKKEYFELDEPEARQAPRVDFAS